MVARYIFDLRGEKDLNAIQSAHDDIVPRLGGLAVFLTIFLFLAIFFLILDQILRFLLKLRFIKSE